MKSKLVGKPISEIRRSLESKEVSARELINEQLLYIRNNDQKTKAFLCLTEDLAHRQADAIDQKIAAGEELPPLAGVPLCLKDNICVPGYPTTCASKILENFHSPYHATVALRLFEAGAVLIGKGNLDEFAMGSSCENSAFEASRNPWNLNKVPGGSSGGPSVAVAAGYSTIGLGSDTGGSIRLPASFCGIVGMKPTYGLVSRFGLVAFASSLDQIGPFATCVQDAATTLAIISGKDQKDSTSIDDAFASHSSRSFPALNLDFAASLPSSEISLKGIKIGIISQLVGGNAVEPDVKKSVDQSIKILSGLGAEVEEVNVDYLDVALPAYYIIATAEASANLARYDGVRYGARVKEATDLLTMYTSTRQSGFGPEVKRRIMLGTYALSSGYYDAYYKKAQQVRRLLKDSFDRAFSRFDVLLSPTSATVAFDIGAKTADPLTMYLSDIATIPVNLAGLPGISIPCGLDRAGLPIGLQLIGPQLSDALILKIAYAFETASEFSGQRCPLLEEACLSNK